MRRRLCCRCRRRCRWCTLTLPELLLLMRLLLLVLLLLPLPLPPLPAPGLLPLLPPARWQVWQAGPLCMPSRCLVRLGYCLGWRGRGRHIRQLRQPRHHGPQQVCWDSLLEVVKGLHQ